LVEIVSYMVMKLIMYLEVLDWCIKLRYMMNGCIWC